MKLCNRLTTIKWHIQLSLITGYLCSSNLRKKRKPHAVFRKRIVWFSKEVQFLFFTWGNLFFTIDKNLNFPTYVGVLKFGFNLYNDFKFEILALKFVEIIFDSWPFSVVASFNFFSAQWKKRCKFFFFIVNTIRSCVYIYMQSNSHRFHNICSSDAIVTT